MTFCFRVSNPALHFYAHVYFLQQRARDSSSSAFALLILVQIAIQKSIYNLLHRLAFHLLVDGTQPDLDNRTFRQIRVRIDPTFRPRHCALYTPDSFSTSATVLHVMQHLGDDMLDQESS